MLSLYFNCRISNKSLIANGVSAGFFYPVIYPKIAPAIEYSQVQVLIKVIKSYSNLEFDAAIFNISLDDGDESIFLEISAVIDTYIRAKNINVSFLRPSTVDEWRHDLVRVSKLIKEQTPVLVVMNHDHLFVDYNAQAFGKIVTSVFSNLNENFGKALVYSHAPESIAELSSGYFNCSQYGIPFKQKDARYLSSILVMTLETLIAYLQRMKEPSNYIGRLIDWPGVTYDRFTLKVFNFPREFFKHFDGYGHFTGLRNIEDLRNGLTKVEFPCASRGVSVLVNFYYGLWVNCFLIYIRDILSNERSFLKGNKKIYISAIERSLNLFKKGYIELDFQSGLLPENTMKELEDALRSHIYYHANDLHILLNNEILLMYPNKFSHVLNKFKYKIKNLIPLCLKNQYQLFFRLREADNKLLISRHNKSEYLSNKSI
jgi:hypothetical protein